MTIHKDVGGVLVLDLCFAGELEKSVAPVNISSARDFYCIIHIILCNRDGLEDDIDIIFFNGFEISFNRTRMTRI
jgi:hypothetical protein